jgi:hypothetical protein
MEYEPSEWRRTLRSKLPAFIANCRPIDDWLVGARRRAYYASLGFRLLGTNAVTAIPELEAMMKSTNKPHSSIQAIYALGNIGDSAIPVLKAALADTSRSNRWYIVANFQRMPSTQKTNALWPLILEALNDHDLSVRKAATNLVEQMASEALTNAAPTPRLTR